MLRVFILMIFIFSVGGVIALASMTIWPWTAIVAAAFIIAAITGRMVWRGWRPLTASGSLWLNWGAHTLFVTALLAATYLLTNFVTARHAPYVYEKGVVTRLYSEKRHQTRRVSRRVYTRGKPYWVYMAKVDAPSGEMTINIGKRRYDALHKGDTLSLPIARGVLGMPVLVTDSIRYPRKTKQRRDRRCRFVGSRGR